MRLLLETIKVWNGRLYNIRYHNERFRRSAKEVFGWDIKDDLEKLIRVPEEARTGLYKCRAIYGAGIERIEFHPYRKNPPKSLRMIIDDEIDYCYKYENRRAIERLFNLRESCDDILIIRKGTITDTSAANIAFYDGFRWITPAAPLLKGTQREKLLSEGVLVEDHIHPSEIGAFKKACLFNAMMGFGEVELQVEHIMQQALRV